MNVTDLIKKLQTIPAKQRELPIVVRANGVSEGIANMFMGVKSDNVVNFPQIGEDPNCIVMQITQPKTDNAAAPAEDTAE